MPAEAQWIASVSASALYWAKCRLAHSDRAAPLEPEASAAADALAHQLAQQGLDAPRFFAHAIPLSVRHESPRQLVKIVLKKLHGLGRPTDSESIARCVATLYRTLLSQAPGLVEELQLRTGPIREQWEARGPGVIATLRRLTDEDVAPQRAEIILVRPATGGSGQAFPLYNSLLIEGVLANSAPELPEVVRLAWLWGQLHFDLPKYAELLGHERMGAVGRLALVPAVLAAAEEVELARCDPHSVALALRNWEESSARGELLLDWWTTYQASRAAWPVALAGLARLLADA